MIAQFSQSHVVVLISPIIQRHLKHNHIMHVYSCTYVHTYIRTYVEDCLYWWLFKLVLSKLTSVMVGATTWQQNTVSEKTETHLLPAPPFYTVNTTLVTLQNVYEQQWQDWFCEVPVSELVLCV